MIPADSGTAMMERENRSGLSLRRILSRTRLASGLRRAPPATAVSLTENTSSSSGIWPAEKRKHFHRHAIRGALENKENTEIR
ncbi:hypothetical protein EYF80_039547 [Liparis tanakae]|uniref:Uncharacterized protein n=1 Tax=Liparis tanakae TaxID=230148 RepID=A0A4Z2GCB2_9TELE|nr:hypothetical protein EYF80_039547 [Liparis tanakae]